MSVVGQLCPIFKGVGFSALMMVFLECVYYVIVVAWTLFYILNTFYNIADGLPWSSCEKGSKEDIDCIDDLYDIFLNFDSITLDVFDNEMYIFYQMAHGQKAIVMTQKDIFPSKTLQHLQMD